MRAAVYKLQWGAPHQVRGAGAGLDRELHTGDPPVTGCGHVDMLRSWEVGCAASETAASASTQHFGAGSWSSLLEQTQHRP
eukprot:1159209-Pelagomonas_calceolata.AAC.5